MPERSFVLIPNKLEWKCVGAGFAPPTTSGEYWFTLDEDMVYTAFFADFGPLDIGKMYTFCKTMDSHMKGGPEMRKLVYYCSSHEHVTANAAVLLLAYMIFVRNMSLEDAYAPFIGVNPPFITYRDAAFCLNTCPLTILDCAMALRRVADMNHFSMGSFDLPRYEQLSKLEHGDVSWIIPGKFVAFSGPLAKKRVLSKGVYSMAPAEYVPLFKKLGITCVIRFNNKCYDKTVFTSNGIHHADLFYEDGGNPTPAIMQRFIEICEREKGAIAVHCKAGLGRTGTNIGAYMMKHYNYSAREATAWCRICRPGSVVGPQQQYLTTVEDQMSKEGAAFRQNKGLSLFWQGSIQDSRSSTKPTGTRTGGLLSAASLGRRAGAVASSPLAARRPNTSGSSNRIGKNARAAARLRSESVGQEGSTGVATTGPRPSTQTRRGGRDGR